MPHLHIPHAESARNRCLALMTIGLGVRPLHHSLISMRYSRLRASRESPLVCRITRTTTRHGKKAQKSESTRGLQSHYFGLSLSDIYPFRTIWYPIRRLQPPSPSNVPTPTRPVIIGVGLYRSLFSCTHPSLFRDNHSNPRLFGGFTLPLDPSGPPWSSNCMVILLQREGKLKMC